MPSDKKKGENRGIELPRDEGRPAEAGRSWFFGIGINQYKHREIPGLNNAAGDVKAVLSLLKEKYELDKEVTLFDGEATRHRILWEFEKLADEIGPWDKLLIYFSGHGFLDKRKKGYWIPHDGKISYNTADLVPNVLIKDKIEDIDSRHTLLVADACFSGAVLFNKRMKKIATLAKELERFKSRLAIASGRHFQLADDGEPGGHSPFAASVLEYLGENQTYELSFTKFCEEVRTRTNERTARQSPVFGRLNLEEDEGGEYIFRLKQDEAQIWSDTLKTGTLLAMSRFLSDFPSGQFSVEARRLLVTWEEEDAYWQGILAKEKISAYHVYLGIYPAGRYAFEAKRRIRALEEKIQQAAINPRSGKKKPISEAGTFTGLRKPSQPDPQPPPNTFTDPRDGQAYRTVELNGLRWMAQNLNYDVGKGCWFYENDPKNGEKYGRLYTWEAAKKACPPGWRLPTDEEWEALAMKFGGYFDWLAREDVGDPEKSYKALSEGGSSGFSALLGGWRDTDGSFSNLDGNGYYWSATEDGSGYAWYYNFNSYSGRLNRDSYDKGFGLSCRCVQD